MKENTIKNLEGFIIIFNLYEKFYL